jgi:hypothetical protein
MKAFPKDSDGRFMDLRDYFASAALPSLVKTLDGYITTPDEVAKLAYKYADAMMKARET